MRRRKLLISIGALGAGGTAAFGTEAFTSVEAQRSVDVAVADDADAFLAIQPLSGNNANQYVSKEANDNTVALDFDDKNPTDTGGEGVNQDAVTQVEDLFKIINQGTQPTSVFFEDDSDAVTFRVTRSTDTTTQGPDGQSLEGAGNSVELETGEQVAVGLTVDTLDNDVSDNLIDEVTIRAESGASGPEQNIPEPQFVVSESPDDNDPNQFGSIQDAVNEAQQGAVVGIEGGFDNPDPSATPDINVAGVTLTGFNGSTPQIGELTVSAGDTTIKNVDVDGSLSIGANDVTIDGVTIEAGDGTTAVDLDGVSDDAAVTLTNNVIDLTAGNDSSAVGIATGSGSGISETIEDNTFQANPDNFLGGEDTFSPVFVGDSNRVDFGTIQSENAFEPGVVESDTPRLSAAVSVTSNDEFLQALTDDRDVASGFRGGPFALSENYINGLDSDDGQSPDGKGTTAVKIDQADINTGNSINLPSDVPGDEGIAAAIINVDGFDTAQFVNGLVRDGTVDVLVPDRADNVTIALGNFNPVNNPSSWSGLTGDNFVIRNVTLQ